VVNASTPITPIDLIEDIIYQSYREWLAGTPLKTATARVIVVTGEGVFIGIMTYGMAKLGFCMGLAEGPFIAVLTGIGYGGSTYVILDNSFTQINEQYLFPYLNQYTRP
jgi:hypothetical protein